MGELNDEGLAVARQRVVAVLAETAVRAGGRATWAEATKTADGEVIHRTGDATLYSGSAGVAWVLASCAPYLADPQAALDLAADALADALERVDGLEAPGLLDGRAGIALAAVVCAAAAPRHPNAEGWAERGNRLLSDLAAQESHATRWDVVSGTAGLVAALAAAARLGGSPDVARSAHRHAETLAASAAPTDGGLAWAQPDEQWLPLCGLAHGASGAAWAFSELATMTPGAACAERYRLLAAGARRYEAAWFDDRRGGWPDLRAGHPGTVDAHPALWCHGAAGIGLERLRAVREGAGPGVAAEAATAVQLTCAATAAALRAGEVGDGLTLCHGHGGAVELLLFAESAFGEPHHRRAARWIVDRTLALVGPDPEWWPNGIAPGASCVGAFTGLSGSLSVLTRVQHPDRVASLALPGSPAG